MTYEFQFDEMHQAGADHADPTRASEYDNKMQKFRNYAQEARAIAEALGLTDTMSVLDMGAGTGALSLEFAGMCKEVTAVDVSSVMLQILQTKARERNIYNITTAHAGFLTFDNAGQTYDRIVSNVVLHHLPDFWKCVALRKVHAMLADDGLFFLHDVVFSFQVDDYESEMNLFLANLEQNTDADFVKDGVLHFREEFSTFDWVLDLMLEKTGFRIEEKKVRNSMAIAYVLSKG